MAALQLHSLMAFTLIIIAITTTTPRVQSIGVNWGTTASHPLPPSKVVELLKLNKINKVKLFDSNPQILESLSGTNIAVTVGIPNSMLHALNSSVKAAESWVHDNLTRYLSSDRTRIEFITSVLVSLVLLALKVHCGWRRAVSPKLRFTILPFRRWAAISIEAALIRAKLADKVKVVIPCSFDAFQSESGLPSKGHFRPDINKTMISVLKFLTKTRSPFFVSISPFLSYHQNKNISLDFALFRQSAHAHNDTRKSYKNSLELSYDTLITALTVAGFPQIDIVISQIGWPTDGAPNATVSNAEAFTKGLLDHFRDKKGTPLRPRATQMEIYLYTLFDEDRRNITAGDFERHWGLFTFDGQAKYEVDFDQGPKRLVNAQAVEYLPSRWCVVNNNLNVSNATARAAEACVDGADCTALSPGGSCWNLSWPGNVSYAFNSYYQEHDQRAESCDFGGLGMITTVDPSVGNCRFNVELKASFSVLVHGLDFGHHLVLFGLVILVLQRL
ncbi:hypothetical protein OSB04_023140 [Centaurea solstitialis]|uniref:X8 domain-containing protein n=1 Tax=Centaurea solstitialis TaxID=347529 RepID=A0AA38SJB0_9ASTR|nr:hypothetical protein OSB04_023140 [Centaurea solstitialis]